MEDSKTRIKVISGNLSIEIEGNEDYVDKILKEPNSLDSLIQKLNIVTVPPAKPAEVVPKPEDKKPKIRRASFKGLYTPKIVNDLDLSSKNTTQSLKDFYSCKKPNSAQESNVVFIYYLKKMKNIENIGIDHLYTCYKEVNERVPGSLEQTVRNTANRTGWLSKDNENVELTIRGENLVEHDLPRPEKPKA